MPAELALTHIVLRGDRRGAVYVLAIVTLLVGTVLVLALMRSSVSHFLNQSSLDDKMAARNVAWAGIDYGYWQVAHQSQGVPYSANVALNTGSFQTNVVDDGARAPGTVRITSVGTVGSCQDTVVRVMEVDATSSVLPYEYAWCENGPVSSTHVIYSSVGTGGMRANGDISLTNGSTSITNGIWSTGTITAGGAVSPQYPNSPPVTFPAIDFAYYDSIATSVYTGNTSITSLDYPAGAVIVVHGNLSIRGTYNGLCTMVATGTITTTGDLRKANSSSFLALIGDDNIAIDRNTTFEGVAYCHNSSGTGTVELKGFATTSGALAGDDISQKLTCTINGDPGLTRDIMTQMHLPGA